MPALKPLTKRFYPALSEVITVDDLPEFLHFAETGLNQLLDKIHYKNLKYTKSQRGDSAFFGVDIVTKNLGLDLPFGMRFVLNPDIDGDSSISSFPISIEYQWELLAVIRAFKTQNFSFTPEAFYELGLKIFKITEGEVLAHILNYFIEEDDISDKFTQLIDTLNGVYPDAQLELPANEEPTVDSVVALIEQNVNIPKSVSAVMFGIYILDLDLKVTKARLEQFYKRLVPAGFEEFIKSLITPRVKATLQLSAGIEFPTKMLKPVDADGKLIPDRKSILAVRGATFFIDSESGIGSDLELSAGLEPTYAEIGNTGLIISFEGAKLDFSRKKNIAEADAAGYGPDFMGMYVKHASIGFARFGKENTSKASARLFAEELLVGTGGVSGKIGLEANGVLHRKFGNFDVELNTFSITFNKGSIVECDIRGKLTFSKSKQGSQPTVIDIMVHISDNGDFKITAIPQKPFPIEWPNVLKLQVLNLEVGKEKKDFYIQMSGILDFTADIPGLGQVLPTGVNFKNLRLWEDGSLEFKNGGLTVDKAFKLKVGPVSLDVNNLSLGSYIKAHKGLQRKYNYFGFDGMINTGRAGVNATGNGIKYYFTTDDNDSDKPFDSFISIDGIGIDMTIPGDAKPEEAMFILKGYLSMSNPDPTITGSQAGTEYTGAISFSMPKLKLAGSAAMRLKPSVPAFIVDIGLELPGALPIGGTGLGIYGFRGLIGQHYLASKDATTPPLPDTATWWDYYKAKSTITGAEGIEIDKFKDESGFSVGAGVSIGTIYDSGFTFSTKLFLYLGLPKVFILQGQAAVLRKRLGLKETTDPPFSALIVIGDNSFMANIGVDYRIPQGGSFDGKIFSLKALLEIAFFFNNSSGWYINLGRDLPESARVQAKILSLFQGYAYLMISSRGIKAGAGARFDAKINLWVVKIELGAFINLGAAISFKPFQIGGFIQAGGYVRIRIFKFKFEISLVLTLAAEAPHPFSIEGTLEIRLRLPWPIRKLGRIKVSIGWTFNRNDGPLREPIPILALPDPNKGYLPAAATNILTDEVFPINYVDYEMVGDTVLIPAPGGAGWQYNFNDENSAAQVTIPLDSYVDIDLLKPVKPTLAKIGGSSSQLPDGYKELLPPQKGISKQIKHEFELLDLGIYAWDTSSSTWKPYHIYEAVTAIADQNVDLANLKAGYWQFNEPNKYKRIRLLSQSMFSFTNEMTSSASDLDAMNFRRKDLFCFENVKKENIVNWKEESVGTVYYPLQPFAIDNVNFTLNGVEGHVKNSADFGANSLFIEDNGGIVNIILPKPVTSLHLDFGANKNDIKVEFISYSYRVTWLGRMSRRFSSVNTQYINNTLQNAQISYEDLSRPIDEVRISIEKDAALDFDGDLIIGGHYELPSTYISPNANLGSVHDVEADKEVILVSLFDKSFDIEEVINKDFHQEEGLVAQWPLDNYLDSVGDNDGLLSGQPDFVPGFFDRTSGEKMQLHGVYSFTSNRDALYIPYAPELKVETGTFSVELTAVFNPYQAGISTLLTKVFEDPISGEKKGYAIHLYQDSPGKVGKTYTDAATVPSFSIWFTTYNEAGHSGIKVSEKYSVDCTTDNLSEKQYKHILVSVDRGSNKLDIFIDKIHKISTAIPAELSLLAKQPKLTVINELRYTTEEVQRRVDENNITAEGFIDEAKILDASLNKTIQPVWRPNTTFAVVVKTRDVVEGRGTAIKNHVFGFKTAGPVGHFAQKNSTYKALVAKDKAAEFKLANLKFYIDYDRSFPDAQSRYDLSKPVFCHNPQVALLFTKQYMNAMFSDWDSYLGLPEIKSSLSIELIDPYDKHLSPQLVWQELPDQAIDMDNYKKLSPDQQVLFLMNKAALEDSCNANPISIVKRRKQGLFQFEDLEASRLYTAVFYANYQPAGQEEQKAEVHRFSFKTSRFATFADQAKSFILDAEEQKYAIYPLTVGFNANYINGTLKKLIDDNIDNDGTLVSRFAVKYDRVVYGGLEIKNLEPIENTVINLIINTDPDTNIRNILGILVRNPEPFNNPKLSADLLADTLKLTLMDAEGKVRAGNLIYTHSKDSSSVFITNVAMNIPEGKMKLDFKYKIFDSEDKLSNTEDYLSPVLPLQINA